MLLTSRTPLTAQAENERRRADGETVNLTDLYRATVKADGRTIYGGVIPAAVRQAFRGENYSDTDREDAAAQLLADVLTSAQVIARKSGGELNAERIPAHLATYSGAYLAACNLRRSEDRRRKREDAAAQDAPTVQLASGTTADDVRPAYSHEQACADAVRILGDLGLARLGRLFPLAYSACRVYVERDAHGVTVTDGDLKRACASLGINGYDAVKKYAQRSRAGRIIPSVRTHSVEAHLVALGADDFDRSTEHPHTAPMRNVHDGRTQREDLDATVRVRRVAPDPRSEPAAWTRSLSTAQRARLESAAAIRRTREAQRKAEAS